MGEFLFLGLGLGLCHAIAETTLLGWYGVDLSLLDLLLVIAIYAALGAGGGAVLWLLVFSVAGRAGRERLLADPRRRWCVFLLVALVAYAGVGCKIANYFSRGWVLWFACAAISLAAFYVLLIVTRKPLNPYRAVIGLLGLGLLSGGVTMGATEIPSMETSGAVLFACCSLLPGIAMLIAMGLAWRPDPAGRSPSLPRGLAMLAALVALDLFLWLQVWPTGFEWEVREQEVAHRATRESPNVLLIVLDTVRAGHMELFGYPRQTMPHLAAFAREECELAIATQATAPVSLESHGSMFTGMYASSHGAHNPFAGDAGRAYFLREDVPTLAQWLAQRGYRTAGISANFAVLGSFGLQRGFGYFDARSARSFRAERLSWLGAFRIQGNRASALVRSVLGGAAARSARWLGFWHPAYRRGAEINREAIGWLEAQPSGAFFLFLNYFDAHVPYVPVAELDQRFAAAPPDLAWRGFPGAVYDTVRNGTAGFRRRALDYIRGQYDAELVYVDQQCQALFESLKRIGRYDDTLIIVVSDHGEAFLEHGWFDHGRTLYESELSVPLLVKLPKGSRAQPPPGIRHMQFVDIFPTVAMVLGLDAPETVEGSAWGVGRDHAISEAFSTPMAADEDGTQDLFAVTVGDWKYIRSSRGQEAAYDLARDPAERRNILGSRPRLEQRAQAILRDRESALMQEVIQKRLDPKVLDGLRALGYVK